MTERSGQYIEVERQAPSSGGEFTIPIPKVDSAPYGSKGSKRVVSTVKRAVVAPVIVGFGLLLAGCVAQAGVDSAPGNVPVLPTDEEKNNASGTIPPWVIGGVDYAYLLRSPSSQKAGEADMLGVIATSYAPFSILPATVYNNETAYEGIQVLNMTGVEVNYAEMEKFRQNFRQYFMENPLLSFGDTRLVLHARPQKSYGLYIMPDYIPLPSSLPSPEGLEPAAYTDYGEQGNISTLRIGPRVTRKELSTDPLVDLYISLGIETCQSLVKVEVQGVDDPLAQEVYCNSLGRAVVAANLGITYEAYATWISSLAMQHPDGRIVLGVPIDASVYERFRQQNTGPIFTNPEGH
ncbi:MAG: hypothetical protein RLY61_262 [Candidatus Parcubacteria bacterium]|jgi:hypothetical protein